MTLFDCQYAFRLFLSVVCSVIMGVLHGFNLESLAAIILFPVLTFSSLASVLYCLRMEVNLDKRKGKVSRHLFLEITSFC